MVDILFERKEIVVQMHKDYIYINSVRIEAQKQKKKKTIVSHRTHGIYRKERRNHVNRLFITFLT